MQQVPLLFVATVVYLKTFSSFEICNFVKSTFLERNCTIIFFTFEHVGSKHTNHELNRFNLRKNLIPVGPIYLLVFLTWQSFVEEHLYHHHHYLLIFLSLSHHFCQTVNYKENQNI